MSMHQVFAAIVADATSGAFSNTAKDRTLIVLAGGGFGGGTLTIEISPDDGVTFVDSGVTGLSAAGVMEVTIPDESQVQLVLTGATTSTLSAWSNLPIPTT